MGTSRGQEIPMLLSCDYDGTGFYTSEPAPGGIDVNKGYEMGISEHVGEEAAAIFVDKGGHNHRAPIEIVRSVAPHLDPHALKIVTAKVVEVKLEVLESCVGKLLEDGTPWPRPSDGFVDLWQKIDEAKEAGEPIGTAIISNGHTRFEQKTFDMLGLSQPDIYLTDDVLNALALNIPHELQVKPSPMPIELAKALFLYKLKVARRAIKADKLYVVHTGDDTVRDEELARNAGVEFVLHDPSDQRGSWQRVATFLHLGNLLIKEAVANA